MSLREQVRLLLIGAGTDPWADRVLEMNAATVDENLPSPVQMVGGLPFLIIKLGPQTPGEQWAGMVDTVEVWPYADDETFQTLDMLCGLVVMRLDHQTVASDGESYSMVYQGAPLQDTPVRMWDANTRPLRFDASATAWVGEDSGEHWLARALREWSADTWPPTGIPTAAQIQTDPTTWQPSDTAPGVYFRTTDLPRVREGADHKPWISIMSATVVGHVLAPSYGVRQDWIEKLAWRLEHDSIHTDHGWLQWQRATRADPNASQDEGQLTIEVTYGAGNLLYDEARIEQPVSKVEGRDGTLVGVSPEPTYP